VILLSDRALKELSILRLNPKRDPRKPCVYVGMTGLPIDHRFENHKNGYKAARLVRKYGKRPRKWRKISREICAMKDTPSPAEHRDSPKLL